MFACVVEPADTISSQDIRYHLQEQDIPCVLWELVVDEIRCLARVSPFQASGDHRTSSVADRRFKHVCHLYTTQVHVGSRRDWHRVWYAAALVPICWRKIPRITDHGEHLDLSAFLVVIWCAYRIKSSSLLRTIAADTTIYFLTMVAAQVYIQLAYSLLEVRFPRSVPTPLC